ncbi:MAG TPA: DUF5615 family PIN-like protein [Herpetosiphonaceae bacterium]|nr:DUF5615 family PIN-like protein [Herpetosiphonaceae bacterium]
MLLLIDEHVPDSITNLFRERGHEVRLVRDSGLKGEADHLIVKAANALGAIVVTFNHRHFASLIARRPTTREGVRYPNAGRISFRCQEVVALQRLREFIDDIELEHAVMQGRGDSRVIISISDNWFSKER